MVKKVQDTFTFDPAMVPGPSKDIVFLRGNWYDMGVQYGEQLKDAVQLIIASKKGFAKKGFGSFDAAWEYVEKNYLPLYEKHIPEMVDLERCCRCNRTGLQRGRCRIVCFQLRRLWMQYYVKLGIIYL